MKNSALHRASLVALALLAGVTLLGVIFLEFGTVERAVLAAETAPPLRLRPATPERPVSLRDRLITGLRARLKSELAFVDAVVAKVEAGELPQRLVDETFFWARMHAMAPRRGNRYQRPIIYFQPALIARANRIGIAF
jgi:hypothetical protein